MSRPTAPLRLDLRPLYFLFSICLLSVSVAGAEVFDLADADPADGSISRVYGSVGPGSHGVPVAGGYDCDGDGHLDYAVGHFQASPFGRDRAGEVDLIFGDSTIGSTYDTADLTSTGILRVAGTAVREATGSEIWIDDVTGDGLGDLLICRQNYTPSMGREGAGALTILVGGMEMRNQADSLQFVDLTTTASAIPRVDFLGAEQYDRLGIWVRTGDVTGDGTADIVLGADQADIMGELNRGEVYVIRGGNHLATPQTIDLASFGATALAGHIARVDPPANSGNFHFGATCQIGDLDGNGRGEVLMAATLNRAGASIRPFAAPISEYQASGGVVRGRLYVAWDDNFPTDTWTAGLNFSVASPPGSVTSIQGGTNNRNFGEEILGGLDYDADGEADLFVGDLTGNESGDGSLVFPGSGYVFYNAAQLKSQTLNMDSLPAWLEVTTILGPRTQAIGADTAAHGDFDGDGIDDLAIGNPDDSPESRLIAGSIFVFYGQAGGWPALLDTRPGGLDPNLTHPRFIEIRGANGTADVDQGDTLCYSAAAGDIDGDGQTDLIVNEMRGNGLAMGVTDVGNVLIISGDALLKAPPTAVRSWTDESPDRVIPPRG